MTEKELADENKELNESTLLGVNNDSFNQEDENEEKETGFLKRYFSPIRSGSLRGSIISIASMSLGPSSLSFPLAIVNLGLIPGIIVFILIALISNWSIKILLYSGMKNKINNYGLLVQKCLGNKMKLITEINNLIFCFGGLMAMQLSATTFFMEIANEFFGVDLKDNKIRLTQIILCMILFQIPLGMLKNISKLQYASMVGSIALIYTVFVMVVESVFYYQEGIQEGRSFNLFTEPNRSYLDSFSILFYGFCIHNCIFSVLSELKQPTLKRSNKVLSRALGLLIFLFSLSAFSGFFSLIEKTPTIFISRPTLKIFNGKDYFLSVSKILFIFCLQCFLAVVNNIFRGSIKSLCNNNQDFSFSTNLILTTFVFILSNSLTYFIDNIVKIVGILGGPCAVIICYVNPILCYVKSNDYPKYHWKNITSILILFVICVFGIATTVNTISNNLS